MTESLAHWLSLREPADTRARSAAVTSALVGALPHDRTVRCVDLGSGTGSNIRYLSSRLPQAQAWLAIDRDASLLARAPAGVDTRAATLGALDDASIFENRDLVTASALLDLVSAAWIAALTAQCRRAGAAVLFVLSYDGRSVCAPREPEDDAVLQLFNAHQRSNDHGFGRAAGPDAAALAAVAFAEAGYIVRRERSDWEIPPGEAALQRELVRGWAEASTAVEPARAGMIAEWLARRLAHIDGGRSRIAVGHEDLAGWLPR